jgi:diguanylate cyclase (GGDEF)-like protein
LTGLPNRKLFRWRLEHMLRQETPGAVILVDLDRFKEVNDVLGHHAGDQLLSAVARRLQDSLRTDDTVARLGGDEFGLLLPEVRDPASAYELAAKAQAAMADELVLDGVSLVVEASFGIAMHPIDGVAGEELLRYADAAMYQAKRGTHGIMHYDKTHTEAHSDRLSLQAEMRLAIETDQLVLHYQPKIDLRTGVVVGVEALVRWQHPQRGLLPPSEFLPSIEQTGLVDPLTAWVLDHALADCGKWLDKGVDWKVAVNVSARNLDSTTFPSVVMAALAESGIPPSRLQIEVTETALSINQDTAAANLRDLAAHGVGVALDDFGVGYASLAHLRSLALTEVKVDRVFVSRVDDSLSDREVIRSLVQLAHGLGLHVTAEGVENAATADWLVSIGCDSAQGFLFSKPVPWIDLLAYRPPAQTSPTPMEALL